MATFSQSPYNFVPLAKEIIFPDWSDKVTQDIPFSDGLDGELELTITAKSPLFIRDGKAGAKKNDPNEELNFFQANGDFYIPGTSIKGMVRNVMEIASYGKMQHIADKRYALRDLQLTKYRALFTNKDLTSKVKAGWLDIGKYDDAPWRIIPCKWASWTRNDYYPDFGNKRMAAAEKYLDFERKNHTLLAKATDIQFVDHVTRNDGSVKQTVPHNEAIFDKNATTSSISGYFVFTGQPQDYNHEKDKGKKREYFFYEEEENNAFNVDEENSFYTDDYGMEVRPNRDDFLFVHEKQPGASAKDWEAWKSGELKEIRNKYFKGRIPVFYIKDDSRLCIGLAMMFRISGKTSTGEALRNTNPDHFPARNSPFLPDLADLIFGYAAKAPLYSLRGRVQFSACKAEGHPMPCMPEKLILGAPKPSFYPAYLKQSENLKKKDDYMTFLDDKAELRGWKRYPALIENEFIPPEKASEDVYCTFIPLPAGTIFHGKVRYHNLRPVELGALIWTIEMRNHYHCHSIGMAKPYGFGKITISVDNIPPDEKDEYKKRFQTYIEEQVGKLKQTVCRFFDLPQIKALLNMAAYENKTTNWTFNYLTLKGHNDVKGCQQKGHEQDAAFLAEYPQPRDKQQPQKQTTKQKASGPETPVDKVINKLPVQIKDACKELKKLGDVKLSLEQVTRIRSKYKKDLSNKYSPVVKEFNEILAKLSASSNT